MEEGEVKSEDDRNMNGVEERGGTWGRMGGWEDGG